MFPVEPHVCAVTELAPGLGYRPALDTSMELRFRVTCSICAFCSLHATEPVAMSAGGFHCDEEGRKVSRLHKVLTASTSLAPGESW